MQAFQCGRTVYQAVGDGFGDFYRVEYIHWNLVIYFESQNSRERHKDTETETFRPLVHCPLASVVSGWVKQKPGGRSLLVSPMWPAGTQHQAPEL